MTYPPPREAEPETVLRVHKAYSGNLRELASLQDAIRAALTKETLAACVNPDPLKAKGFF